MSFRAVEDRASITKRNSLAERAAIFVLLPWFFVVLYLNFQRTPFNRNDVLFFIRSYSQFHLWHAYALKAAVAAAVAIWIMWVAVKTGELLLGKLMPSLQLSALERRVFSAGIGVIAISILTLLLGAVRLWYQPVFWSVLIAATIAYVPKRRWKFDWRTSLPTITPLEQWWAKAALGLLLIAGAILAIGALSPETFYDSLHYHLAVPNLYALHHGIYNEPNFAYAAMIMLVQIFWGFGLTAGNVITVKILHGSMTLLLFFAFIALERRYLARNSALLGALLFLSMPLVVGNATTAGIDVASTTLQFLAVFALICALADDHEPESERHWFCLAGLLTGAAVACRYTFLPSIPIACIAIVWLQIRQGRKSAMVLRSLSIFLIYAGVVMFPFYFKNVVFHHNPVYPIAGTWWGEPRFALENWNKITAATLPPDLSSAAAFLHVGLRFVRDAWAITMNGSDGTQDFIGPLLLGLLPLLLFVRARGVATRVLSIYSLLLWITWLFTNTVHMRFGMPMLAILSLLLAHALLSVPATPVLQHLALALCLCGAGWNIYYSFLINAYKDSWRVVGGMISEEKFLGSSHYSYPTPDYEALIWMNRNLPAGSKVMMAGDARSFYTQVPVVPSSIFDTHAIILAAGEAQNGEDLARLLRERGVTHLFVNFGEAIRTQLASPIRFDDRTWEIFDDFWRHHVRLIWSSVTKSPDAKALFVFEFRSTCDAIPNLFERWKPVSIHEPPPTADTRCAPDAHR